MNIKDLLSYRTKNKKHGMKQGTFPDTDFILTKGTYNFNAPYLESQLQSVSENKESMCLTPFESGVPQRGAPVHEDRNSYLDTRSENNTTTIFSNAETQEIDLDGLCQILKNNLAKNTPDQQQFFIRGLGDNRFEYYTVDDLNKIDALGNDIHNKVVDIFAPKNKQ